LLSNDNYQELLRGYQAEQKDLTKLSVITAELDKVTDYESGIKQLKSIVDGYANIQTHLSHRDRLPQKARRQNNPRNQHNLQLY